MMFSGSLLFSGGYLPDFTEDGDGVGTWRIWKAFWMVGMA